MAVIDTERSSASKYADKFGFDALDLESFSPENYMEAINAAASAGYNVLIIDSLSHSWMGKGGALEMASAAEKRTGNKFTSWRDVSPVYARMVDTIVSAPMHVIATLRSKVEYVMEQNERGKMAPRKAGMGAIGKDGMEFEFDVVGEMTQENDLVITKTRCSDLNNKVFNKPGKEVADILNSWLTDGAPAVEKKPDPAPAHPATETVTSESAENGNAAAIRLWATKIDECQSVAKLQELAKLLADLPLDVKAGLKGAYSSRLAALKASEAT